ncbi:plastocyanin/azurin family copper-binding protein [Magnetococcus sp. PR-3]|uniref:plastocyanin/azurin family copper-binding protein n=1 Tax=Magnetococcus sp. PR-3 TaxID=3120355 RepID=UPI002FCE3475
MKSCLRLLTALFTLFTLQAQAAEPVTVQVFHSPSHHDHRVAKTMPMVDVDQVADLEASTPQEMFKFVPNFVKLQRGQSIRFLNSLGQHTVVSIEGMMPQGAQAFEIAHEKEALVTFDQPGVYGIRCRVHTRYGMVMLVQVGDKLPNLEQAKKARISRRAKKQFKKLFKQVSVTP